MSKSNDVVQFSTTELQVLQMAIKSLRDIMVRRRKKEISGSQIFNILNDDINSLDRLSTKLFTLSGGN